MHPLETWLRDECDGSVYFPDQDSQFNLQDSDVSPYSALVVEGPTASGLNMRVGFSSGRTGGQSISSTPAASSSQHQSPLPSASSSAAAGHGPPTFRSVIAPRKVPASLIKIMKANMIAAKKTGGKPEFQCTGQMYIELTDTTANVGQVCEAVRRQWGSEYTIVSVEGVEIDDSSATQGRYMTCSQYDVMAWFFIIGLSFWKSPQRKLYEVTFSDVQQCSRCHSRSSNDLYQDVPDSSDDDIDRDDLNPKKKRKYDDRPLQRLTDEVTAIRDIITDMMSLTSDTSVPLSLRRVLRDTFKCQICHNVPVRRSAAGIS